MHFSPGSALCGSLFTSLNITVSSVFIHTALGFTMMRPADITLSCILSELLGPLCTNYLMGPGLMGKKKSIILPNYLKSIGLQVAKHVQCNFSFIERTRMVKRTFTKWKYYFSFRAVIMKSLFFPHSPYVLYCFLSTNVYIYIYRNKHCSPTSFSS